MRQNRGSGGSDKVPAPGPIWFFVTFALIAFIFFRSLETGESGADPRTIPYTEFKSLVADRAIVRVEIDNREITATEGAAGFAADGLVDPTLRSIAPPDGDPDLLPLLEANGVIVEFAKPRDDSAWIYLLPWLVLIAFYIWITRRMAKSMGGFGGLPRGLGDIIGGGAAKERDPGERVTFKDVAGQDSAKQEVAELVEFLRDPERFRVVGAQAPRGVLLVGPPGTGKTLLARALAGEADVPFFSTSGSEFIEVFVGVGASRVRKMFEEARERAPAIIFIDELDSIGRVRGTGLGGGHDEREQTLNQILAELDGFSGREAVVVLAATNRPDVLDPALLRPGRFDRHVSLELPDKNARRAILDVHIKHTPLAMDVDLDAVAAGTPGFSGADIKNLINESAITAAREGATEVSMRHMDEARDKVMLGTVRTLAIQPSEKHRLAVHEAGHTAAAHFLPKADPLYKVTIIPRGRSLGGTHMLPEEERHTLPEDYLRATLAVTLAGRAAEKIFLGTVSSGADDDIRRATQTARAMVSRWGMSEEIGPVDLRDSDEHPFLGREIAHPRRFADKTAAKVDEDVAKLLREAEATAAKAIEEHRPKVEALIAQLEREEILDRDQIEACLGEANLPDAPARIIGTG